MPHRLSFLPALRLRWEDHSLYLSPFVPHCVPPAHNGDHTLHVSRHSSHRRVPPLHYDLRHPVHRHHSICVKRAPSLAQHSQDAPLGPLRVPGPDPTLAVHAQAGARRPAPQAAATPAANSSREAANANSRVWLKPLHQHLLYLDERWEHSGKPREKLLWGLGAWNADVILLLPAPLSETSRVDSSTATEKNPEQLARWCCRIKQTTIWS